MLPIPTATRPPAHSSPTAASQLDKHRPASSIATSALNFFRPPSPSPASPSINSLPTASSAMPPSPGQQQQRQVDSASTADHYRSSSESSPVVYSSLQATPYQSQAPSPRAAAVERRNSLDDFVHIDAVTTPSLPKSASGSAAATQPNSHLAAPTSASSASPTPFRKWSLTSLLTAVTSATPNLPRVNVRRATQSIHAWLSPQRRAGEGGEGDWADDEDGETAQEGMEEQIEPSLLASEGEWDVAKLEYGREQRRNYRFVNKRLADMRETWFVTYGPVLEKQMKAWSGKDITGMPDLELKKLARKGIPAGLRAVVWGRAVHLTQILDDNKGRYAALVATVPDRDHVKMIDKDLDRTFINHPAFHLPPMLSRLRRVLCAFATHCPHIGYCQSLNFLAGFLLLFFDEESAFWLMTTIVTVVLPPDYFTDSMIGLHTDLTVLNTLLSTHLPRLHSHLQAMRVDIRPIAFPWFLSLFIKTLPIESALRVWDCLVCEGSKILFRTALGLLSLHEDRIVRLCDFGRLYSLISQMGVGQFDCERLMDESLRMRGISRRLLERMRRKERRKMEQEIADKPGRAHGGGGGGAGETAAGADGAEDETKRGEERVDEEDVIGNWTEDEEDVIEGAFTPASSRRSTGSSGSRLSSGDGQAAQSSGGSNSVDTSASSETTSREASSASGEHQQPVTNGTHDVSAIT